jgi:hypothetical protein
MQIRHGIDFFAIDFVDAANIDPDLDRKPSSATTCLRGSGILFQAYPEYLQNH